MCTATKRRRRRIINITCSCCIDMRSIIEYFRFMCHLSFALLACLNYNSSLWIYTTQLLYIYNVRRTSSFCFSTSGHHDRCTNQYAGREFRIDCNLHISCRCVHVVQCTSRSNYVPLYICAFFFFFFVFFIGKVRVYRGKCNSSALPKSTKKRVFP